MNSYEKIYNLLTETRSPESRGKTKGRKLFGTPGRKGRLTGKTTGEVRAQGAGQAAGKLIAKARVRRKAASEIAAGPTTPSVPSAVRALKSTADRQERSAEEKKAQGRKAVSFERGQRIFKKMDARAEAKKNTEDFRSGTLSQRRGK
tara:strand:- start:561 stop:1001 length:441 start_codon:yes stop_codon:yes gene_type:complete